MSCNAYVLERLARQGLPTPIFPRGVEIDWDRTIAP